MPGAPLQRHDLVWLSPHAWQCVLAGADAEPPWDEVAAAALRHWAAADLPLVVARQSPHWLGTDDADRVTLGLAAPQTWGRRRLFVRAALGGLRQRGQFPPLAQIAEQLPATPRAGRHALPAALDAIGVPARVYGSFGWHALTGLPYRHPASDLDLLLPVAHAQQADAAVAVLTRADRAPPRLDGELLFANGDAVAWREWAAWRAGQVDQVLVKHLRGATLVQGEAVGA